jgi:hypothetical protein
MLEISNLQEDGDLLRNAATSHFLNAIPPKMALFVRRDNNRALSAKTCYASLF